ncbi:AAA family ATPase [Hymenobacter sp. BT188]|uniref:AAA family ATPase n=1 Tax=Hymenobacter sp. BT188 TaxID=2763504 RepID=UPI001650DB7C|nr:SbcC/MukB-like Walker B domain-containing protein [Hymenobacter sp. BT188]MBC6607334.1 AAA family ATPase [Hymenobacter sp. BT188]
MKILRVRFSNLNSLRGQHEIDFSHSPLSDAGLFAITGPTGAGKTTILDAITLALYGQVPRHEGGVEQVMSHGTGESWAEVEFQVNGRRYRSKWGQYRARKKAEGKLQDSRMELSEEPSGPTDAAEDNWPIIESYKSKVPARVAELSGLEYRQFLRSVLLAQGEFTRFLKSTAGERAQLLEKITDTRKYSDISVFAFRKAKEEAQQVEVLRTGLAGVTLLSNEEVSAIETEMAAIEQQAQTSTAAQQKLQEALTWLTKLADLATRQQRAQTTLATLAAEAETLAPLRQRLTAHEQALPFRTPWELLQAADTRLQRMHREAAQAREQRPQLQQQLDAVQTSRATAQQARDEAIANQEEQNPKLLEAEKLDAVLQAEEAQLTKEKQEYEQRNEQCKRQKAEYEQAISQASRLGEQLKELTAWLTLHGRRTELPNIRPQLSSHLEDLADVDRELQELTTQQKIQTSALQQAQQLGAQATARQADAEKQATELATTQQQTEAERDTWMGRLQQFAAGLQDQHAVQEKHLTDLRTLVQTQQLILSHEEARRYLVAGEPCPLCGAAEHPFALGALGVTTDSLQRDKEREELLGQQVRALNGRVQKLLTAVGMLENAGGQISTENLQIHRPLSVEEEEMAPKQARALAQRLRELQDQHHAATVLRTKAHGEQQLATEQKRQAEAKLTELTEKLEDARDRTPKIREQVTSMLAYFQLTFTGDNGTALMGQLEQLTTEYEQQREALNRAESQRAAAQAQGEELKKALTETQEWLTTRKAELVRHHEAIQRQRQQRQQFFAGVDVAQARQQLMNTVKTLTDAYERSHQAFCEHESQLSRTDERLRQLNQETAREQQERDQLQAKLIADLQAANLPPSPDELRARLLPDLEARRLAEQLHTHERALLTTQSALTEALQQLELEQSKELTFESADAIREQLRAAERNLADLHQQLGQQRQRLQDHHQGLERHAELAATLEKQQQEARRWRQLAELIGSADGKKFSEFAQGLTLTRLTELANRHLTRLTDRYRIARNPQEYLDLLVVDHYQADSTRSMSSLSGGESFLVSLALALGLSELAGHKTQIETLFIDEGFGTLDADALEVALTALEILQGTGKMIGIISHVEALKERVTTQINVRKGVGGISTLRVVGFGEND